MLPLWAGTWLQLPAQQPPNPAGIWHLQTQHWCLPVSPSTSGVDTRIPSALSNDCLALAKGWAAPRSLHPLWLVSASKSRVGGGLWIFIKDCYSTAACCKGIRLPKGVWVQACLFPSTFPTYELCHCSEKAGVPPSHYEQSCSSPEFHRNPGHLQWWKSRMTLCCHKTFLWLS